MRQTSFKVYLSLRWSIPLSGENPALHTAIRPLEILVVDVRSWLVVTSLRGLLYVFTRTTEDGPLCATSWRKRSYSALSCYECASDLYRQGTFLGELL